MLARLRRPKPNTKTKLLSTKLQSGRKLAATDGDEGDDDGDDDDEQRMRIFEPVLDTEK